MTVVTLDIFNAVIRKDLEETALYSSRCRKPYTAEIIINETVKLPLGELGFQQGYRSIEDLMYFVTENRIRDLLEAKVFVVLKNADFTSGNGPMLLHKVFADIEDAHTYIMDEKGIYGSEQSYTLHYGINIKGELYCYNHYNGYQIKIMELI